MKQYLSNILNLSFRWVKSAAYNWKIGVWSLIFIGVGGFVAINFVKAKKDCSVCEGEKSKLINALIEIKKELAPIANDATARVKAATMVNFAAFLIDTTKPQNQSQQVARKVMTKIDSLLRQIQVKSVPDNQKQYKTN